MTETSVIPEPSYFLHRHREFDSSLFDESSEAIFFGRSAPPVDSPITTSYLSE